MQSWLLRQLDLGDDFVAHLDRATFAFQHPVWFWVGVGFLVPLAVFVYLRQRWNLPNVPSALRWTLTITRVLILALLVVILGSPMLRLDLRAEKRPIVALLFDQSQSMLVLPAGPFDSEAELAKIATAAGYRAAGSTTDPDTRRALNRMTRAKLAHAVVTSGEALLKELGKKYEVQVLAFAQAPARQGFDAAKPRLPEPPPPGGAGSHATHIGDAIGKVMDEAGGRAVAGILVFSDGQNTGGRSPAEAARAAGAAGTPIFAVPVGSSSARKDVRIADLFATELVTAGDRVRVAVTLESSGFDGRAVPVELRDGDKVLDRKEIVLRDAEQQQVELGFEAATPGVRNLTVRVPPQPEEPDYLRGNNSDSALVRISDQRMKVLVVEGRPRWDYRFLRNAMKRDKGLGGRAGKEIDVVLEAEWRRWPAEKRLAALPAKLDALAEYQAVVLGDVSDRLLTPAFVKLLDQAVREKGVGLIVQPGPLAMPHGHGKALRDLLPVHLTEGAPGRYPRGIPSFRLELAPDGMVHEAMRLYPDRGRNAVAWANLPPYYWSAAADRPTASATVLAWEPTETRFGKVPLIAHHYAGQGRVLFVGTDSTFLWRQNVGDRFFYRFWGQAVRFVARREARGGKKSWMEARPMRAQPGEDAEVELMAFAADGAPLTAAKQVVRVTGGGGTKAIEMSADPAVKGRYTGRFTPPAPGDYKLAFDAPGEKVPVETRLLVQLATEELRRPAVDRAELDRLASVSGGAVIELPDLDSVRDRLKGETTYTPVLREATIWDNWLVLALLVLLYTIDVGLRRLMGLS